MLESSANIFGDASTSKSGNGFAQQAGPKVKSLQSEARPGVEIGDGKRF